MATKENIIIDQGASFATSITVTDDNGNAANLTGYSAAGQMRKNYTSNVVVASFSTSIPIPNNGIVFITLSANVTSNIADGRYVYDVKTTDADGFVTRIVEGIATVNPGVTR